MKSKKLIALIVAMVFLLTLTGCNNLGFVVENMLGAPKLEGDMYPVQQALEAAVGHDITLKYPSSGDYRSAFVLKDLDSDGTNEAVALYSATSDGVATMHINVIASERKKWTSCGDLSVVGNDVEAVSFADLDGDGILEIIVGWMVYGTVDKQVGVYTFKEKALTQRAMESYTNFVCGDMSSDGIDDLALVYLNTVDKTAAAKVLTLNQSGVLESGAVSLDGGVTSYSAPIISKALDGRPALYVDAVKGVGMLTEVVWFEDSTLKSLYDPVAMETGATYRASTVASRDFNLDGIIDIPFLEILDSTANLNDSDKVYYTVWHSFDNGALTATISTFMNYTDGYYIQVPIEWKDKIHLLRKTESRLRIFYGLDSELETFSEELFRIMAVPDANYDESDLREQGYVVIETGGGYVYLTKIAEGNSFNITDDTVKSMFGLIK